MVKSGHGRHLSTLTSEGARFFPRVIEWVGHILWLAKAKPPMGCGSFLSFLTELALRDPKFRAIGV